MAPKATAVPTAARPATPAPATKTLAGETLPAAGTCPAKKRPKALAASITARYPPMLGMEGNAFLPELERALHDQSQRRGGDRPGEQRHVVVQRESRGDALAIAARADEGRDGRGADVDHRRGLDARQD